MPPPGTATNQNSEIQGLGQSISKFSHITGSKLNKTYNCRDPCLGVNCSMHSKWVSYCSNTRSTNIFFYTSSLVNESEKAFDTNTSTHIVDSICVDNVACNGVINSTSNFCNDSTYFDSSVINNYRSICSFDVSLASIPRGWGNSPQAPLNSTNSGDGFVYVSNNTNVTYRV